MYAQLVSMPTPTQEYATLHASPLCMLTIQHTDASTIVSIPLQMTIIEDVWTYVTRTCILALTIQQTCVFSDVHNCLITTMKIVYASFTVKLQGISQILQQGNASVGVQM
jgi:hypothetical protein